MEETNQVPVFTKEEINQKIDSGDKDMINRVLTNTVRVKAEEPVEEVQQPTTVEPAAETPKEPSIDEIIAKEQEAARARVREVESTYAELEMKRKLEHDQLLSQIAQEKKAREEIERKLREAAVTRVASGPENVQEEDEDLASDYAKNTRKMVSELKETISSLATGDPRIQTLEEKIQKYEQMEADRKRVDEQERADRKRKEAEQRISNEVKSLQSKYTELQSENDFIKMSEDFNSFRTALVNAVGATTQADQDRMLMTYFDENRGRELREAVKEQGVVPPKDYDKFIKIAELIDMTNGIEYDPILERFVDIKNANGETVRYRSIEEAYRVKNFNNELINTKRKAFKDIKTKLDTFNSNPAKLDNKQTAPIDNAITQDQIQMALNNAEVYVRDPARYNILVKAYEAIGQTPPKPRFKQNR